MSTLERIARDNCSTRSRADASRLYLKPKAVGISDDGQGHLLSNSRRDTTNQVLSPNVTHLISLDGASSLPFSTRSPPRRAQPARTLASGGRGELDWDRAALLKLSDSVRTNLEHRRSVGPDIEKLSGFLEAALRDEEQQCGRPTLDIETIKYARLDKLLAEILQFAEKEKTKAAAACARGRPSMAGTGAAGTSCGGGGSSIRSDNFFPLQFRVLVSHVKNLWRAWRRRFREQYSMMDQNRCAALVQAGGRLKDVSFNTSAAYNLGMWQTKVGDPISELEGDLQFDPGHWWLNITCAERDGMVGSSLEMPTKGRYCITTLPLLTGQEEWIRDNTSKYVREGESRDMHIALISQVGRQIRVLRGYRLKSVLAPQAGVRYDGLFTIKQYGCKLDNKMNIYRIELTLERVPSPKVSLEDIGSIPRPSQLDDWNLYEKLEGDKIKLLRGETSYLDWKLRRQEEKTDREGWRRARLFRASASR
ncbi:uncharacterized protein F4812DRAFT_460161 [Daldinia caldariorum]|uniref:uncharacterized protein n=1 Tax=Daldinia caldariorum TaxID=326644 RepID=UPI002008A8AD|nr:uncharacterized protein F4812DRAFT_460161 [Daldinia caldariorum]KAI1467314.1 hypothetical protein F4812DRAFT_460161 [Daldinia caldariorum]